MASGAELKIEFTEGSYPLSSMQQGMLFHTLRARERGVDISQIVVDCPENVDAAAFDQAWQSLAERHAILRTSFRWEGLDEPRQQVHPQVRIPVARKDWQGLTEAEQAAKLESLLEEERRIGFEPAVAPLMRVVLICGGANTGETPGVAGGTSALLSQVARRFQFVWTYHHILLDARSLPLLLNELFAIYEGLRVGKAPVLPERRPYQDYIEWVQEQNWSKAENFWRQKLKGFIATTPLIAASASVQGLPQGEQQIEIGAELTAALRRVAKENGITLNTFIQGAWGLLMSRYSSEEEVVFGAVRACRRSTIPEADVMAGLFINTVPVRMRVLPDIGLLPWLKELREQWIEVREFEHTPLVKIQEWSEVPAGSPLFESILNVQDPSWDSVLKAQGGSWAERKFRSRHQPGYPLAMDVYGGQGLSAKIFYNRQRFDDQTISRMLGHFKILLEGMAAVQPERKLSSLPMLSKTERQQLLVDWNRTEPELGDTGDGGCCVHQHFEAQAARTPEALAVTGAGKELNYRELNERANQLAGQLQALGVRPDGLVGICAERSAEMVVGQLAILKAGGAYVPIDPAYPKERITYMIDDAGISVVLTQEKHMQALPTNVRLICLEDVLRCPIDPKRAGNSASMAAPKHLAYVIYTSGSTGRPKGVEIEHAGLVNLVTWHQRTYQVTPATRATQLAGPAFDAAVWELWPYLTAGASVHIPGPELRLAPKALLDWLAAQKINVCFLPTPLAEAVLDAPWPKGIALTALLTGGDRLHRRPGVPLPCPLINHYGPTESTVVTTAGAVAPGPDTSSPSIGRPIANTKVYILDPQLQPVPIGVPGELHIGGIGLARGYHNRAELTAQKFIANPFSDDPQSRLYKTGDRVRYLSNGSIEFLGRIDQQVKIRGFRIEPGEVEAVLCQHPRVREAAVIARENLAGDPRLVAYVVASSEPAASVDELRDFLKQKLPEHMVPATIVPLPALPLTPNGKVDRKALPSPDPEAELQRAFVEPRTATEKALAGIWAELLHLPRVGVHDNFFQIGGHSLSATQVIARVRSRFPVPLAVQDLFDCPTVAALVERIDSSGGREVLGRTQDNMQMHEVGDQTNRLTPHPGPLPFGGRGESNGAQALMRNGEARPSVLSFAQERLWFLEQLQPGQAFNNIPAAIRLQGELDMAALEKSLSEIVRRHETLRTAFSNQKGQPAATVCAVEQVALPVIDLRHLPSEEREGEARRMAEAEARKPFDLAQGRLLRAKLFQLDLRDHLLLITTHHIVGDGWSLGILFRELGALYKQYQRGRDSQESSLNGCSPTLPELPMQYADFADCQRQSTDGDILEEQLGYWKEQLKGRVPPLDLPTDRPRPPVQTYNGTTHFFTLPAALSGALKKLSRHEDVTLFMLLLAGFQALLHRYSGQEDIVVGSAISGRNRAETENLIGLFLNTLVLRTDLSGDPSFRQLLQRVRKVALDAYAHQDVPFEKLVQSLPVERDLSRSPLFQVMFVLQPAPFQSATMNGLRLTPVPLGNGGSKFDLTLFVEEHGEGLSGSIEYNSDLFDSATIVRLLGHFETLLGAIVENPNQPLSLLPILTNGERQQLLSEWNKTQVAYPVDKCIHQLFEEQVERTPEAVAVVFEDEQLTYRELNERSNRLACHLQSLGVGPEVRVGICLNRSLEMLIGLLGILKAGGCYLPLDPAYPKERLAFMLEDSQATVLVSEEKLVAGFSTHGVKVVSPNALPLSAPFSQSSGNPDSGVTSENLAYVIYTSGSTGKPKGVMLRHRNAVNFFTGMDARVGTEPGVWLAVTSISFDISVLELFWTLTRGFKVVIQGEEGAFRGTETRNRQSDRRMDLSLFYFASDAGRAGDDKYKLLIEGAKFADQHGLTAVWTPERHFHPFGGLYPNPAVTSAALAMVTQHVELRAGSIVLPLHDPISVVEEWAVVDHLSKGRTALSFASGWHPNDFVFAPQNYARRKEIMRDGIETVRKLWRGEPIQRPGGTGESVTIKAFPKPLQPEASIWITSAGAEETFRQAGEIGANLLTHLSGQSMEHLARKIEIYRTAWRKQGHAQKEGRISLMLHTFVWDNAGFVWEKVRQPFYEYLKAYRDLSTNGQNGHGSSCKPAAAAGKDLNSDIDALLNNAVDRYLGTSGLFGTPEGCLQTIEKLKAIGVDEVACLIDFGIEPELVLSSLRHLHQLKESCQQTPKVRRASYTLPELLVRHGVTHFQCTPSLAGMLIQDPQALPALRSLRKLLLGGEALPASLVKQLNIRGQILNMYGPTETTVWSTTHEVATAEGSIPIGRPIANTEIYIVDRHFQPVPVGIPGELLIGGAGVARGYLNRPELTAERFVAHPFSNRPGARLYRTGDLVRFLADGTIEFLGRLDHQVKLRGFRIELGEIETALCEHPQVREGVVVLREFSAGDKRLVAYFVPNAPAVKVADIRNYLKGRLPDYMVPSAFELMERLPLTPNGKVDRKALPAPAGIRAASETAFVPVQNQVEKRVAAIWQKLLRVERIGLNDNFFDLGGHSLLAVQAQAQLSEEFRTDLSILKLFQYPTIRSLAKFLDAAPNEPISFQKVRERARRQKGALGGRRSTNEVLI